MPAKKKRRFNLEQICEKCGIELETAKNSPITEDALKEIYHDFCGDDSYYREIMAEILTILNGALLGKAHSIRARIKDPEHLIGKVIRNVNERPEKYKDISVDNYSKIVTDLIGVRIIILDKHDWRVVHNALLKLFTNDPARYARKGNDIVDNFEKYKLPEDQKDDNTQTVQEIRRAWSYHAEQPVVYITTEDDRDEYVDDNLRVDNAKKHYRSIHYIIRYDEVYFEIQVRTLFEEGWLEFDHRIKYPSDRNNSKKEQYIQILSSLAGAADSLIAFYREEDFKMPTKKQKSPSTVVSTTREVAPAVTLREKMRIRF